METVEMTFNLKADIEVQVCVSEQTDFVHLN